MRRMAVQMVALAIAAVLGSTGCGDSGPNEEPTGGSGGSGSIVPKPPGTGGSGGGEGGAGGGAGGSGGEEPGTGFQVDTIHPGYGTIDGGTAITISGAGFVTSVPDEALGASTVVLFGENPSIDTRVVDDQTILATSPVGVVGEVDVVVQNASGEQRCGGCFEYLPRLEIEAIKPNAGHVDGGDRITLEGEGLTEETVVLFGGRAGLAPEANGDGTLSLTVPPGDEPGLVDVRAFSASRQSLLRRAFRYRTDLRIESIEPPVSPLGGGEIVLLKGEGFSTATRVFFGGTEALVRLGEQGLEVTVPRGAALGPVRVEATDGVSTATHPFAYVDPAKRDFALYALAPEQGPAEGGAEVTILGSGLDAGDLVVYFGETPASAVTVESGNLARATAPAGAAGIVDVRVRNAAGMETLPGAYRYLRAAALSGVEPAAGPVEGGTPITLHGAGFPANPRVFVGAFEATEVARLDEGRIEAVTPPGTDGSVALRVVDADAPELRLTLRDAFTYEGPLSLAVVDPSSGARAGGTRVFVRGTGFRGEMKVAFGGNDAESVTVLDPYTLEVITPRGNLGLVDLRVEREDGEVAELEGAFSYFDPSSGYGGSSGGPLNGVLNVTAIALSGPEENAPIEGCTVYVGADESARLTKVTDERGQATFSSPSLVKAVSLTVHCEHYEIASINNQVSENVTALLAYNGPPPPPPDPPPPPPPPVPPTVVAGNVYGFKLPPSRTLEANEEAIARVSLAYPNIYGAPPFGQMPTLEVPYEGGMFTFQIPGPYYGSVFATYGILNTDTNAFEPLLMGYSRGVSVPQSEKKLDVEVVLDTRLDQEVAVTLENPPWGARNSTQVTAFLDLGSDGVIPVGMASNLDEPDQVLLTHLPRISGDNLVFQALGHTEGTVPFSIAYRRQGGDVTEGVTIGPMMGPVTMIDPIVIPGFALPFSGTFEWEVEPSAVEPDVIHINVYQPEAPPFVPDPIPEWHVVLPGDERRVSIPEAVLDELRAKFGGETILRVDLITGSQPRFEFPEWNYMNISLGNFSSFTFHQFHIVL